MNRREMRTQFSFKRQESFWQQRTGSCNSSRKQEKSRDSIRFVADTIQFYEKNIVCSSFIWTAFRLTFNDPQSAHSFSHTSLKIIRTQLTIQLRITLIHINRWQQMSEALTISSIIFVCSVLVSILFCCYCIVIASAFFVCLFFLVHGSSLLSCKRRHFFLSTSSKCNCSY